MSRAVKIYSPQEFVEEITGYRYHFEGYDVIEEIKDALCENGLGNLRSFLFTDINRIAANDLSVVLVDVGDCVADGLWKCEYRWFEVPEYF